MTSGKARATQSGNARAFPDEVRVPRGALVAAAVLLAFTVAVAGTARLTGRNHVAPTPAQPLLSRDLAFADRADGAVVVTDATTGRPVALVAPETGGFLRGILRGLVREHRLNDLPDGTAFRLTRWSDGRLSIEDPAMRERFELEAFGATNEAAFARFLDEPQAGRTTQGAEAAGQ